MLETSARLLRMLSLLQARRDWTGPQLAQRLDVSERTVRNDVERLRTIGYPIDATRGAAGGYRLGVGGQLPPLLLDDDEAVAIVLGLRAATGLDGVEETSLRALTKLEQVLPHRLRRRVAALNAYAVTVPTDDPYPVVDAELLSTIAACCRDTERLRFDYESHPGHGSRRDVEPHRLINWGRRWYLLAWDLDRQDWRTFRIDRITPRVPTGPRFVPRPPPEDVGAYVSARASAAAWRYHTTVVVHAPAPVIAERIPPAAGTVEARDERTCLFRTGADSLDTIAVHLSLLDVGFEVTEPPELVDKVRELAHRYAQAVAPSASHPDDRVS
ncbi:DNA-binding transcriptional regulator [Microbacterium sp. B35-04]|uniref:helix-turn-helix transcriptional regulator n=1 Tax=Microbacterium sp. B35-04 TaxID=1961716 RepID=UPI0013D84207|nr:DNA-binding transcriptional regulator [Microbacterium sp. B35-04]